MKIENIRVRLELLKAIASLCVSFPMFIPLVDTNGDGVYGKHLILIVSNEK